MEATLERPIERRKNDIDLPSYGDWLASNSPTLKGAALESNIIGLWFARQTSKGSPVTFTVGSKRARWVGGDLQTNRADGSENYSDQTLFSGTEDFVNTIIGNGAPVVQAQPGITAYLVWLSNGQETVTGGVNAVVTIPAGTATGGNFQVQVVIAQGSYQGTYVTGNLLWNSTAAAIATAVAALPPFAAIGATITGAGGPMNTTAVTLTFTGGMAAQPVPLPTIVSAGLTGGTIGAPTMTTAGTPFTHVSTPTDTGGFYFGVVKSVGKTVIHRTQYNDCRIQSLRIEASSASKLAKLTPTFISLDPGVVLAADPTKQDDGQPPFFYTEGQGQFVIDGTPYSGQSAFAAVFNWATQEYYGDDVIPYDLINQAATATLEGLTVLIDGQGITRYNQQIYGTPTPAPNARPIKSLPPNGSYTATLNKVNPATGLVMASLKVEFFGIKWSPDLNIPANPDGGAVELALAGAMRKVPGNLLPFRITTQNQDAAYTA